MKKVLRTIDSVSSYTGGFLKYFCYALVLVITYDVIMRYVFNKPSLWAYDTAIMLGGTIYILSWAYTHLHKGHVRVDIFYTHLSPRGKAIIDVAGALFLFFPLIVALIAISFSWMVESWAIEEKWVETYWYPPMAPFRTMVLIAYCLFFFQFVAQFIRDSYFLVRGKPYD